MRKIAYLILLASTLLLLSCNKKSEKWISRYPFRLNEQTHDQLETIFLDENITSEYRLMLLNHILPEVEKKADIPTINLIISDIINKYPEDPYLGYYYYLIGFNWEKLEMNDLANQYYHYAVNNTQDILVQGESLHLNCFQNLLDTTVDPSFKIYLSELLISKFSDRISLGLYHYVLGRNYEKLGDWSTAYNHYRQFLYYPNTTIPDEPNAYEKVHRKVKLYDSYSSPAFPTLDSVLYSVKNAISSRDFALLDTYKSNNFFIMSWTQEQEKLILNPDMPFKSYSQRIISYSPSIEQFSNDEEAYLMTWGWSFRVHYWYFNFKKIDFPPDPEINGKWEFAGVYLGKPL